MPRITRIATNHSKRNINVQCSIILRCTPEVVWDFTQDFSKRASWDPAFSACTLLPGEPRRAFVKSTFLCAVLEYKIFDRPYKTTLQMTDVASYIVEGGGGSWTYEDRPGGETLWTQSNSLVLRTTFLARLLRPAIKYFFRRNTRVAMKNAKRILESIA